MVTAVLGNLTLDLMAGEFSEVSCVFPSASVFTGAQGPSVEVLLGKVESRTVSLLAKVTLTPGRADSAGRLLGLGWGGQWQQGRSVGCGPGALAHGRPSTWRGPRGTWGLQGSHWTALWPGLPGASCVGVALGTAHTLEAELPSHWAAGVGTWAWS